MVEKNDRFIAALIHTAENTYGSYDKNKGTFGNDGVAINFKELLAKVNSILSDEQDPTKRFRSAFASALIIACKSCPEMLNSDNLDTTFDACATIKMSKTKEPLVIRIKKKLGISLPKEITYRDVKQKIDTLKTKYAGDFNLDDKSAQALWDVVLDHCEYEMGAALKVMGYFFIKLNPKARDSIGTKYPINSDIFENPQLLEQIVEHRISTARNSNTDLDTMYKAALRRHRATTMVNDNLEELSGGGRLTSQPWNGGTPSMNHLKSVLAREDYGLGR